MSLEAFTRNPSNRQSFSELEGEVLSFWRDDDTFAASVAARADNERWSFYDGPPFANGLPHYGHLLTGYAKDTFPRFQTMRGKHVPRVFGWDTHGLPAELEAMKQLGLKEKADVEAMGVDVFNAEAKKSVLRYVDEWKSYVERQGRWVDFDGGYKTLDTGYMESVMWAFKTLYDKGLVYQGFRVLPYCWKDGTPLSTHELNMDADGYKDVVDTTVTVGFRLNEDLLGYQDVQVLAWTTTPWTLPMNMALAVNPEMEYVLVTASNGARYVLAASRLAEHATALGYEDVASVAVLGRFRGSEMVGMSYQPLFDYYTEDERAVGAWRVLGGAFVTDSDGTGVVHVAPSHGDDDQKVAEAAGMQTFLSVDDGGNYLDAVSDFAGRNVFEANDDVVALLKSRGDVFSKERTAHSYPHCWRCGTRLMYRAVSSWFVKVTALRERMLELNADVSWVPENDSFVNWVSNARDWSVSRNRFWGSPVPVWVSDDANYPRMDVYGSLAEMEADFGVEVTDLHRPFVDELVRPNPDDPTGKSTMRRVTDVLDVWFDSGCMPFAQYHYPFDNAEAFRAAYPADFVVEYSAQTRGWFYVMHVLATALFDEAPYKTVVSHGVVLGGDGEKMSKSKQNYPDVSKVFNRDGSDAMRWFLLSSPVLRGGNLSVTDEGVRDSVREVMLPLWNTFSFYRLYKGAGSYRTEYANVLDRYLMSRLGRYVSEMTEAMEGFDSFRACKLSFEFVEMLTNWYLRRSRERFWAEDVDAFDALYTALEVLCRVLAPLLPMLTESVWKALTGERSVHMADWPDAAGFPVDEELVAGMELARAVASVGLALRKKSNVRVRQPLSRLVVSADLSEFEELLRDELNVKAVEFGNVVAKKKVKLNAPLVGRKFGKDAQKVFAGVCEGNWKESNGVLTVGELTLEGDEFEMLDDSTADNVGFAGNVSVMLDVTLTDELEAEGFVRDMTRAMQDARKNAGLNVSDRVRLEVSFASRKDYERFSAAYTTSVATELLATEFRYLDTATSGHEYLEVVKAGAYTNVGDVTVGLTVVD